MGRNVSAMIGKYVPHIREKCKDPHKFIVPYIISNIKFENVMLDLGVSINVMPMNVFKFLSLGPLQPTGVVIQLANRSTAYPAGLVEDVLVSDCTSLYTCHACTASKAHDWTPPVDLMCDAVYALGFVIQYEDVPYVLKTRLVHLLHEFHGVAGEDPHKHLKEFHVVFSTMKPHDAFPHSLDGSVKDWLYYLAPRSITSWGDLKRSFLGKFFPFSRITTIRKDIYGIRKQHGESLYEYWERFKRLCASCHHHHISEQPLLHYFYEGLNNMDRSIIDAASGGALGDMTPFEARCLIEKMTSNSQQFNAGSGDAIVVRSVHDYVAFTLCLPFLLEPRTDDHSEAYAVNIYNNRPSQQ
ncbi:hypothetical protein Lal_00013479 [Lupinus albus]|nr:hypothetical protein Lal_00013479 [Lupinus albus]